MSLNAVDLIKDQLGIAEVIGRYTQLQRKGSRLAGLCPVHQEKSPSFYVDEQKGLYHCFGCGIGGDIIKFVQEVENLDFRESLEFLAEIAGIELPKSRGGGPGRDVIENLRAISEEAAAFYMDNLRGHDAVGEYIASRGLQDATVRLFKLGVAGAQWDALYLHLKDKYDPKLLMQSGLFKMGKTGKPYDLFRDRLIFPIHDAFGHIVAFGGRLLGGAEGPKYINSPETPLYTKGKLVYNLHFAKPYLKRDPTVVVVEGYMDVLQVYQAGIGAVIAPLGTAFTHDQAKQVKRYAEKVILNFDGDAAGFKAARASIEILLQHDVKLGVVTLPDGQDPDDFIRASGADAYRGELETAKDFLTFLLEYLIAGEDLADDPHRTSIVAQDLCQTLQSIGDPVVHNFYLDKASEELGVARHILEEVTARKSRPKRPERTRREAKGARREVRNPFNHIESKFLYQVMHHPDYTESLSDELKETLPRVLQNHFGDRSWVLDFIFGDREQDFEEQLTVVPDPYRRFFRDIYINEGYAESDPAKWRSLVVDLIREMLEKLVAVTRDQIKSLPDTATDRINALRRKMLEYRRYSQALLK